MNKITRMLLILTITIVGSGVASGFDRLDRFMKHENRKLKRIEKRNLRRERGKNNANAIQEEGRRSQDIYVSLYER
jgi:hypothetical protein